MKTLVDSSVWIGHFKKADPKLIALLEANEALIHPFVLQELYLGRPKGKTQVFERLSKLPVVQILSQSQFFYFLDHHSLIGKGVGLVDSHLLGAALENKLQIFTLDKKLRRIADLVLAKHIHA